MNRERLIVVAEHLLNKVQPENFNLKMWRMAQTQALGWASVAPIPDERLHDCGFAACAIGHACSIPQLKADGLHVTGSTNTPAFGELRSWHAVVAFFGLTYTEADYLFDVDSYIYPIYSTEVAADAPEQITPRMVADRILAFVAGYKPTHHEQAAHAE